MTLDDTIISAEGRVALVNIRKITLLRLFITPCIIHSCRNVTYLNALYPSSGNVNEGCV